VELIGLYLVAAGLLVGAGVAKTVRPSDTARALKALPGIRAVPTPLLREATRVGAAAEVVLGLAALMAPRPLIGILLAASYVLFAAVTAIVRVRGGAVSSCGCFGRADTPASWLHVVLDLTLAVAAAAVASSAAATATTLGVLAHQPWSGVPLLFASAVGVWLTYLAMTGLPALGNQLRRPGRVRMP
jgi:hypothetical protein